MSENSQNNWAGPQLDRRSALGLGIGLAATMAGSAAFGAPTATALLDPKKPEDARQIYRKLRFRTDSGLVFSWVKGPYMAEIGGTVTPMYEINLGSIQRITQRPDGGFDIRDLEISFRTDPDTGKRLKEFRNPITNETIPVVVRPQGPNSLTVSPDNVLSFPPPPGGTKYDMTHFPKPPFILGDDVFIRDRSHTVVTAPDGGVSMLNEISTISGPRAQVLDPAVTNIYTRVQSNDVRTWPSWLNMGDRPGIMALYAVGGKVPSFNDLPTDWLEMLHEFAPEIAADPIAALDRVPGKTG